MASWAESALFGVDRTAKILSIKPEPYDAVQGKQWSITGYDTYVTESRQPVDYVERC